MKFKFKILLLASLLAAAAGACKQGAETAKREADKLPTAQVRAQTIEWRSVPLTEEVVGTVTAKVRATLEAKQPGVIKELSVAVGEKVRGGATIAVLESAETAARLEQAEAALEQAGRDWKRTSSLFEQQSATRAERDTAEARLRMAKGAVAETQAAQAHTRIVAPFDGVIARKLADAGDLAVPGKPLVEMEDPGSLQVEMDVPEGLVANLASGSEFVISGPAGARKSGALRELAPASDLATRTRKVKLKLNDPSGLASGQFVRVSIPLGKREVLFAPQGAVVTRGQLEIAFTVENQRARLRLIKTGLRSDGLVEILSGLRSGENVVVEGAEQLVDGQPLEVK